MTVYVSNFKPGVGTWSVTHDDAPGGPHGGLIAPSAVIYATRPDGSAEWRLLRVSCPFPGCDAETMHPVTGIAPAYSSQELFVRTLLRAGVACPCGQLPAGRPLLLVLAHLKTHADQMEIPGRWAVTSAGFVP